jgi:hypothetical protein
MDNFPPERNQLDLPLKAYPDKSEEAAFGRGPIVFSIPEALS